MNVGSVLINKLGREKIDIYIQGCKKKKFGRKFINISKTTKLIKLKFLSDYLSVIFNVS